MRIRPPSEREAGEPACLQHTSAETLCLLQHPEPVHYTLDHVAGASRWGEGNRFGGGLGRWHVQSPSQQTLGHRRPFADYHNINDGQCMITQCLPYCGPACSSQHDIFKIVGRPIVENTLAGFNSSVFVYGQTGSGKVRLLFLCLKLVCGQGRMDCSC